MCAIAQRSAAQQCQPMAILEIHLWHGQPKKFDFAHLTALLAATEIERALRFRFPEDRDAFALVHAMRRIELSRILGARPQDMDFGRSEKGRPTLRNVQVRDFAFSASRRRELVVFAASRLPRLGVDVERIAPVENPEQLLSKFLDHESLASISTGTSREHSAAFAKLWTITEACAKARGTGLETFSPLLSVRFESPDDAVVLDGSIRWRCQLISPDPTHQIAIAHSDVGKIAVNIQEWRTA